MAAYAVDALAWCRAHLGKGYFAGGCRCEVWCPTQDCSGWCVAACRAGAGLWVPCINSAGFAVWGRQAGKLISEDEAIWTPFALGIKGPNGGEAGNGPLGHIVPMVGDGLHTYEAMSTRRGCTIGTATGRGFVRWMRVPGLIYGPKPPPPSTMEQDMVILPGIGSPTGRRRTAKPNASGLFVELWNNGNIVGRDAPLPGDDPDMRRWVPKNKDGTPALTAANSLAGVALTSDLKTLVAMRKDGGTYDGQVLE